MGIDHSSLDALMPEQLLDLPEVDTLHQKVGGEAVAEGMDGSVLHNASLFNCFPYRDLDALVADMVASDLAAPRVHRQIGRRKNILPFPFFCSIRIFSGKGGREIYFTMTPFAIILQKSPSYAIFAFAGIFDQKRSQVK